MEGGAAVAVDRQNLAVFHEGGILAQRLYGLWRAKPAFHQVERFRAQPGVGDVLRGHGADAAARVGATRRHRR